MTLDIASQIWPAGRQFDTPEIKIFSKKLYFVVFCQPKIKIFCDMLEKVQLSNEFELHCTLRMPPCAICDLFWHMFTFPMTMAL